MTLLVVRFNDFLELYLLSKLFQWECDNPNYLVKVQLIGKNE